MVKRKKLEDKTEGGGNYFASPKSSIEFISTGCKTLDLALGGGWAERRIANIVGDKSTGKTLLCIETAANFALKYPKGRIIYRESEAAFDEPYAQALGMPIDRVEFLEDDEEFYTVEDMFEDLNYICDTTTEPTLYFVDSLDALSDRAEMARDIDQGTYGGDKPKKLSEMFRRLTKRCAKSNVTAIIVSQVRDKIGVTFGRKWTRSGGKAMDFYASQVLYLAQKEKEYKTISGIKRPIGISIIASVEKNKVGLPFRKAEFELLFGYGVNDPLACLKWLKEAKSLDQIDTLNNTSPDKDLRKFAKELIEGDREEYKEWMEEIHGLVEDRWWEIETGFMPKQGKYGAI